MNIKEEQGKEGTRGKNRFHFCCSIICARMHTSTADLTDQQKQMLPLSCKVRPLLLSGLQGPNPALMCAMGILCRAFLGCRNMKHISQESLCRVCIGKHGKGNSHSGYLFHVCRLSLKSGISGGYLCKRDTWPGAPKASGA